MSFGLVKLIDPIALTIAGTFTPKGAYSGATTYSVGDMVSYNGSSYVLYAAATSGTLPTDTTKWTLLAAQGATGAAGAAGAAGATGATGPAGSNGLVTSVVAGSNITVDSTTPSAPIVATTSDVNTTATQTLTNKTLTSPVINTPTGIVKGDVGLGNVDNTSDATKNSATVTLTNKRITKRVATLTDAATVTPDVDSYDGGKLLTLSQATTIANPTGTPTAFQQYVLRIKSTASQTLSFGTQYRGSSDVALPASTTGSSKTDYFGFQWNSDDSKFDLIALNRGF